MSTFVGYFKAILLEEQFWYYLTYSWGLIRELINFLSGISPKVNAIRTRFLLYTSHIHMQIQNTYAIAGGLCCFSYERFINFWLRFMVTQGERHTILTMLTILSDHPQRAAHLVMFKISIHLCRSRPEKLNRRCNGRKLNSVPQWQKLNSLPPWSNLNWPFFKVLKFSGSSLLGMTSSTYQSHFLSRCLLWKLLYPLRTSVNCTNWLGS